VVPFQNVRLGPLLFDVWIKLLAIWLSHFRTRTEGAEKPADAREKRQEPGRREASPFHVSLDYCLPHQHLSFEEVGVE
jgi:hypothetical protein